MAPTTEPSPFPSQPRTTSPSREPTQVALIRLPSGTDPDQVIRDFPEVWSVVVGGPDLDFSPGIPDDWKQDGPGQKAAARAKTLIELVTASWGVTRHTGEPVSQALALVQREISRLQRHLLAWEDFHALTGLGKGEVDYWNETVGIVWEYMTTLVEKDLPTNHAKAQTAEEYQALEEASHIQLSDYKGIDFKALKARIDIVDYIGRYTTLRKDGQRHKGKCPLPDHVEKTASLVVYPNQSWYCFGCHRGGDVINFAQQMGIGASALADDS